MGDGKCPDIYDCRLGIDKILRENLKLKSQFRFTTKELYIIYNALVNAQKYEEGFSDAYNHKGPESAAASKRANQFKKLGKKLGTYLEIDPVGPLEKLINESELVSINEIRDFKKKGLL